MAFLQADEALLLTPTQQQAELSNRLAMLGETNTEVQTAQLKKEASLGYSEAQLTQWLGHGPPWEKRDVETLIHTLADQKAMADWVPKWADKQLKRDDDDDYNDAPASLLQERERASAAKDHPRHHQREEPTYSTTNFTQADLAIKQEDPLDKWGDVDIDSVPGSEVESTVAPPTMKAKWTRDGNVTWHPAQGTKKLLTPVHSKSQ